MLAIKKTLTYFSIFSLMFSNIALAGKDLVTSDQGDLHSTSARFKPIIGDRYAQEDWLLSTKDNTKPLTTIRPNTLSSTSKIDALHIYESGEIISQDLEGNRSSIKPYNQPQEVKDAIHHGHLMSLLGHFNLYVTKPGEELKIQLMGGLKGGMKKTNIGGKPHMCNFDKGIGICTPIGSGNVSSGGSLNSSLNTRRIPSVGGGSGSTSDTYGGPSAKDDFRLPSDNPNPYPSNFDPFKGKDDPFSPNWDPFQPSTKGHLEQFGIPTPHIYPTYSPAELEYYRQQELKRRAQEIQNSLENELKYTLQYHQDNKSKAFTSLNKTESQAVVNYAKDLCLNGQCKPDTDALKQAIKQVVYDTPSHYVLGWYQSLDEHGVQFYKNLNKKHSQQIVETAKELAYGQGHKPDSATITQAYNQVMTRELQYVFDYHKQTTKAADYQDLPSEYEATLIREALGNMKSRHGEFKGPDTAPLTESFKYHRTLGESLLKGYGHAVDDLLCATLGSCPAHANYVKLGMEILKQAPRAVTWVGLSASTMWNGKVKNFVTDIVDWVKSPASIFAFPGIWDLKAKVLIESGWEEAPKAFVTLEQNLKPKVLSGEINKGNFKDYINYKDTTGKGDHGGTLRTAHKNNTQGSCGDMDLDPDSDDEYKTTKHGVSRKIEREIKSADELDALKNPLKVKDVKIDINGLKSQRYIGKKVEVVINPDTKKIISVNKTHAKVLEKLLR